MHHSSVQLLFHFGLRRRTGDSCSACDAGLGMLVRPRHKLSRGKTTDHSNSSWGWRPLETQDRVLGVCKAGAPGTLVLGGLGGGSLPRSPIPGYLGGGSSPKSRISGGAWVETPQDHIFSRFWGAEPPEHLFRRCVGEGREPSDAQEQVILGLPPPRSPRIDDPGSPA